MHVGSPEFREPLGAESTNDSMQVAVDVSCRAQSRVYTLHSPEDIANISGGVY